MSGRGKDDGKNAEQKELDDIEAKYRAMIVAGKAKYPLASENLSYWFSKKGGTKTISAKHFQNDSAVKNHLLKKHRAIFLSEKDRKKGIIPRIKKDNKAGKTYPMTWEDSMYSNLKTDLFFALGGFTVKSDVKVKVTKLDGDTAEVEFLSWTCVASDHYNWDVGKTTDIPFLGNVADKDAALLEKAGRAKSFKIKSESWTVKDSKILKPAKIKLK